MDLAANAPPHPAASFMPAAILCPDQVSTHSNNNIIYLN